MMRSRIIGLALALGLCTAPLHAYQPTTVISLAATVTNIHGSPANLGAVYCFNPSTNALSWLQLFNTAAANVTLGTTAPAATYEIAVSGNGPGVVSEAGGLIFNQGLSAAVTTTANGSTAATGAITCTFAVQ